MLPQYEDDLTQNFVIKEQPGSTYKLDTSKDRLVGESNGIDAIKQAIYLILNTERYRHLIYSWNYGVELEDLIGQPVPYVYSLIKSRISEALMQDDRVLSVKNFNFERKGKVVAVTFSIKTTEGEILTEREVTI